MNATITDTLTVSALDDCPVYRCEHDGQTHEHPRRHVVEARHRAALDDAVARQTVTLDVARAAHAAWAEHIHRCAWCNYDEACPTCELGEEQAGLIVCRPEELASLHACNCSAGGGGKGYRLLTAMRAGVDLYGWEAVAAWNAAA